MDEIKVSQNLKQFLDCVSEYRKLYTFATEKVETEQKRQQDLLHAIEFEPHVGERSKLATRLRQCRLDRRYWKDIAEEVETVVKFFEDPQHSKILNKMNQLLGQIRKVEKYHEDRHYNPRIKDTGN